MPSVGMFMANICQSYDCVVDRLFREDEKGSIYLAHTQKVLIFSMMFYRRVEARGRLPEHNTPVGRLVD